MLRYLFVFVSIFPFMFLFTTTEVKKEELKVELLVPASAEAGSEVTVKLKITGGAVKGFAKYTDRLPEGVTAVAGELGDATFTADNGQVKIIWLEFPKEDEIIVEYKMKFAATTNGNIELGGKFSYLENNEKRVFSVFKKQIQVGKSAALATKTEVEEKHNEISVLVQRRLVSSKENIHQIEVTVTHTGLDGFGKIQEYVPLGATIEKGEVENAVFSSIKNKVKFVWMSLPKEETYVVTYYVDLSDAESKDIQSLTGNFSYLENDVSKKVKIEFVSTDAILASNSTAAKETGSVSSKTEPNESSKPESSSLGKEKIAVISPTVAAGATGAVAANEMKKEGEKSNKEEIASNESSGKIEETKENLENVFEDTLVDEVAVEEEEKQNEIKEKEKGVEPFEEVAMESGISEEKEKKEPAPLVANTAPKVKPASKTTPKPTSSPVMSGVKYRVQIAAGANVVDAAYFKLRHNFETSFNIENHQGWVKYTTGSFSMYKDARDSRETINGAGHDFDGPFVTAYNDGTRITVQEALMISSQKWFK